MTVRENVYYTLSGMSDEPVLVMLREASSDVYRFVEPSGCLVPLVPKQAFDTGDISVKEIDEDDLPLSLLAEI